MNLLYCGDEKTEDGLVISVLSLMKNITEELHITVLTMSLKTAEKAYQPISEKTVCFLDSYLKKQNGKSRIRLIDATEEFQRMLPSANMDTRFTPYCMLRLYADLLDMPDRILYLDNDVVCRRDCSNFYYQDMEGREVAGVLDYYGRWFFRNRLTHLDYLNSGVLLLNLKQIRQTGLFKKCREMCKTKKMFLPDQSAINKLAVSKEICDRKYNEQRRLRQDTILQHFTTGFRFFPWIHTITVKPWQIEKMHEELKLVEYDDVLTEYESVMTEIRKNNGK